MTDTVDRDRRILLLGLSALGVVYGDIGTSPIYALRECFHGSHPFPPTPDNVLGVLSLIFWALMIIISLKYLLFVMRADNHGEGGILALLALLAPWHDHSRKSRLLLFARAVRRSAPLWRWGHYPGNIGPLRRRRAGDCGSGAETVRAADHDHGPGAPLPLPEARHLPDRHGVRSCHAPLVPTLALLGISWIVRAPQVLAAINPIHAVDFFTKRLARLCRPRGVFLVVTGGEALYADMGHFGRFPIRLAWFALVLPALLLNYFGQAALILLHPEQSQQPFFNLAPGWALYPLVLLATLATVIASQAVISGAFSLTRQAVQLGQCPHVHIIQTSQEEIGQIYIPSVNWLLMIVTISLVLGFGSSSKLAGAYGVAVTTTMVITVVLAFFVAIHKWQWHPIAAGLVTIHVPDGGPGIFRSEHAENRVWRVVSPGSGRNRLHHDGDLAPGQGDPRPTSRRNKGTSRALPAADCRTIPRYAFRARQYSWSSRFPAHLPNCSIISPITRCFMNRSYFSAS